MARQEAKPQGPREAGPAARKRRGRPGARGVGGAAARCPGVRGSGPARGSRAAASQEAPPPPLLLGLLLLAALPEHCLAHPGKHLAPALRSGRFLQEPGRPSGPAPGAAAAEGEVFAAPALGFSPPFAAATAGELTEMCPPGGTAGRGSKKRCFRIFFLDKLQVLPSGPAGTLHLDNGMVWLGHLKRDVF